MNLFYNILNKLTGKTGSMGGPDLTADREIEWTYVAARIGRYADSSSRVLDFGCGVGVLSFAAASLGARVLAIDLVPLQFHVSYENIEFRQVDVMALDEKAERFDLVLNCSTIEHVGLGGRYGAREAADGDIEAMRKMRRLLKPGGHMLMTLPIGRDGVIRPLHRIFGEKRLPRMLEGFEVVESIFWRKDARNAWTRCSQEEAMREVGNERYYALGCMTLKNTGLA
jgi:SAM-dependent methyltransferase